MVGASSRTSMTAPKGSERRKVYVQAKRQDRARGIRRSRMRKVSMIDNSFRRDSVAYYGGDDQDKQSKLVVWVALERIRWSQVVFVSRNGTNREDIKARWEDDREDERCPISNLAEYKTENNKHDAQERCDNCRKLGAFAKGSSNKEGPTRKYEAKQDMDGKDKADICLGKNAEVPCQADDHPGGEVG